MRQLNENMQNCDILNNAKVSFKLCWSILWNIKHLCNADMQIFLRFRLNSLAALVHIFLRLAIGQTQLCYMDGRGEGSGEGGVQTTKIYAKYWLKKHKIG